ncbi:DUF4097 domain-containing protein [Bacillaceae bacterium SIJ1]|uniref:DUF4097 family beta strand repeat-containing protein n=1 Tax=Litoribacterium kuwaitense TaxID=1398745 RepID=UPI0013EAA311|nr:DUF4097 family beta strand repeat-containing protein [Litoribacterium kuwaitense]NGP45528.1 DUF4097 domain-containing protein [Litoribacterium kuwaitense]
MTLFVVGLGLLNSSTSNFEYRSKINNVNGIQLNADLANIKIVSHSQDLSIDVQGQKPIFGEPNIDITYSQDKAMINVHTTNQGWKKIIPGIRNKSEILLNVPAGLLEDIQLETENGNIDVDQVTGASRLSLTSDVGTISMNSFKGGLLNVHSGNGSIHLGEVEGQINIRSKVGSVKNLFLKKIHGENNIEVSNGNVKVQLPDMTKIADLGLNISTKNGKILSKEHKLEMINKGPGKEVIHQTQNNEAKLNISVSVGNIEIN